MKYLSKYILLGILVLLIGYILHFQKNDDNTLREIQILRDSIIKHQKNLEGSFIKQKEGIKEINKILNNSKNIFRNNKIQQKEINTKYDNQLKNIDSGSINTDSIRIILSKFIR